MLENVVKEYMEKIIQMLKRIARKSIKQTMLKEKYYQKINGEQMQMLQDIARDYMENKFRCQGVLLENTLNKTY